jgi:putative ABC transport system permease protein
LVSQRTHEIGIRLAIGADRSQVLAMILKQGLTLAVVGIAVGLAAALGLTRLMASLLYQVRAADPLTFVAVPVVLIGVTVVASYLPARRATRVSPTTALRTQ